MISVHQQSLVAPTLSGISLNKQRTTRKSLSVSSGVHLSQLHRQCKYIYTSRIEIVFVPLC